MKLKPGTLVVLEGIDASGKSTQMELLKEQFPQDLFIHSPSGHNELGQRIYHLTEESGNLHPLARQFLHLASHVHMYEDEIIPALRTRGVFMDRNWWSTVAYAYSTGITTTPRDPNWEWLAQLPTQGRTATVTFVFLDEWKQDPHNNDALRQAYYALWAPLQWAHIVPGRPEQETLAWLIGQLELLVQ